MIVYDEQADKLYLSPACLPLIVRHYIQPRYPNGFATGYPAEFYDQETAERVLAYGTDILEFVQSHLD